MISSSVHLSFSFQYFIPSAIAGAVFLLKGSGIICALETEPSVRGMEFRAEET